MQSTTCKTKKKIGKSTGSLVLQNKIEKLKMQSAFPKFHFRGRGTGKVLACRMCRAFWFIKVASSNPKLCPQMPLTIFNFQFSPKLNGHNIHSPRTYLAQLHFYTVALAGNEARIAVERDDEFQRGGHAAWVPRQSTKRYGMLMRKWRNGNEEMCILQSGITSNQFSVAVARS